LAAKIGASIFLQDSISVTSEPDNTATKSLKMAKVAKPKKREVSSHSRAHRRAASPQPDLTKGLPKSAEKEKNEHWLYNAQAGGVHKKTKEKKMTRQQRQRQLKAFEHADRNFAKHETKVEKSKDRARKVQARAAAWEELNGTVGEDAVKDKVEPEDDEDEDWEDEDVDVEKGLDAIIAEQAVPALTREEFKISKENISKHAEPDEIDEVT
jgi:hypothetical protein